MEALAILAALMLPLIVIGSLVAIPAAAVAFFSGAMDGDKQQYPSLYPGGDYNNGWIRPLNHFYDQGYSRYSVRMKRREDNKNKYNSKG